MNKINFDICYNSINYSGSWRASCPLPALQRFPHANFTGQDQLLQSFW